MQKYWLKCILASITHQVGSFGHDWFLSWMDHNHCLVHLRAHHHPCQHSHPLLPQEGRPEHGQNEDGKNKHQQGWWSEDHLCPSWGVIYLLFLHNTKQVQTKSGKGSWYEEQWPKTENQISTNRQKIEFLGFSRWSRFCWKLACQICLLQSPGPAATSKWP